MIVDVHAHVFPWLGGASGFDSVAAHMRYLQQSMCGAPFPVRRVRDNRLVEEETLWTLWDGRNPGPEGLYEVNFRVGRFGRLEWTKNGEDYYIQFMPPSLQDVTAPGELMIAQMDYVGVSKAVLQNAAAYGRLNDYIGECVRRYPGRFIGLAQVNEAEADKGNEILELRRAIMELKLSGLFFGTGRFFVRGFRDRIDDQKFFPFWEEVQSLEIPVFWSISAGPGGTARDYLDQMARFDAWAHTFSDIESVLVMGFPVQLFRKNGRVDVPTELLKAWRNPNVFLEVTFPISEGRWFDYPYAETQQVIKYLYEKLGAQKLLWGSDMPNVERYCTYRQSLEYLRRYCDLISAADMDLILGGNAMQLFRLDRSSREASARKR